MSELSKEYLDQKLHSVVTKDDVHAIVYGAVEKFARIVSTRFKEQREYLEDRVELRLEDLALAVEYGFEEQRFYLEHKIDAKGDEIVKRMEDEFTA